VHAVNVLLAKARDTTPLNPTAIWWPLSVGFRPLLRGLGIFSLRPLNCKHFSKSSEILTRRVFTPQPNDVNAVIQYCWH